MKRTLQVLTQAALLCSATLSLAAQTAADPPAVLRIFREYIKEGKGSAHRNNENAFMLEAAVQKYPANIIGMTTVTGGSEAWFLEGHESFGAIEATLAAYDRPDARFNQLDELDGEFRTASRSFFAVYRPEISFHGQELMQNLPKARFVTITLIHMRVGHESDFDEIAKMASDAMLKAMSDQPVVVYQVYSGLANGTFLLIEASPSLKAMDSIPERSQAMVKAMGDTGSKRFFKAMADGFVDSEAMVFALDPRMSYVSKEFAAADPSFWNPKPEETKAPAKPKSKAAAKTSAAK